MSNTAKHDTKSCGCSKKSNNSKNIIIALVAINIIASAASAINTININSKIKVILENQANIEYEVNHIEPEDIIRYVYTDTSKTTLTETVTENTTETETETTTDTQTEVCDKSDIIEETEVVESTSDSNNNDESETVSTRKVIYKYSVPSGDTSFKSYMNYKCLSSSSAQGKLQKNAWTDEYGLRRVGDDYCVAVGSYYSTTIGERFEVEFDNGKIITVIVGDCKQDCHTDSTNRYRNVYDSYGNHISKNVLEFIVDTSVLHKKSKQMGTVSEIDHLSGNIVRITKITME